MLDFCRLGMPAAGIPGRARPLGSKSSEREGAAGGAGVGSPGSDGGLGKPGSEGREKDGRDGDGKDGREKPPPELSWAGCSALGFTFFP